MDKELLEVLRSMLKEELQPIQKDINGMKADMNGMKTDINGMKKDMDSMKIDINGMKADIKFIKVQQNEHGELIRILIDKAEVNKAEHDLLRYDMAKVLETVNNMRKDLAAVEIVTARNMENIAHLKAIK